MREIPKERAYFIINETEKFILEVIGISKLYPKSNSKQQKYARHMLFYWLRKKYDMPSKVMAKKYGLTSDRVKKDIYCFQQRVKKENLLIEAL